MYSLSVDGDLAGHGVDGESAALGTVKAGWLPISWL
jgi:hypothetical protein